MAPVLAVTALLLGPATAGAEVFKCRDANGKTHYADRPCAGKELDYKPRELNQISADQLTGGRKSAKGDGSKAAGEGWTSPLDPVANCRKQGGTFSKEFRGCLLP